MTGETGPAQFISTISFELRGISNSCSQKSRDFLALGFKEFQPFDLLTRGLLELLRNYQIACRPVYR